MMDEQIEAFQKDMQAYALLDLLDHPDPDLSEAGELPKKLAIQETQACHLARAIVRLEASEKRQIEAFQKDMQAWQHHLAALQLRRDALRNLLRDWMLRNDVPKLSSPFVTASITKGKTKIVVDEEILAIDMCRMMGVDNAVIHKWSLVKKEFDAIYNADPRPFKDIAHEETSEPGLMIRGR